MALAISRGQHLQAVELYISSNRTHQKRSQRFWCSWMGTAFFDQVPARLIQRGLKAAGERLEDYINTQASISEQPLPGTQSSAQSLSEPVATSSHPQPAQIGLVPYPTRLFENTPYSIDTLPVAPFTFDDDEDGPLIDPSQMSDTIMKGVTNNNRPFIAVKVQRMGDTDSDEMGDVAHATHVIILISCHTQTIRSKYLNHGWKQVRPFDDQEPKFFRAQFTAVQDGSIVSFSLQAVNKFKTLLSGSESTDLNGRKWRLAQVQ